jgi:hypothetical protein
MGYDKLIAVDPGVRGCGVAVFSEGVLERALYLRPAPGDPKTTRDRAALMARAVGEWVRFVVEGRKTVVCELPVAYPPRGRAKKNVDPNDLIALAVVVGAAAGSAASSKLVTPREWKGTVDADAFTERIKSRILPDESPWFYLPAPYLHHNVYDAYGLGLWYLGRLHADRIIERE